jgi:hypothetical protein
MSEVMSGIDLLMNKKRISSDAMSTISSVSASSSPRKVSITIPPASAAGPADVTVRGSHQDDMSSYGGDEDDEYPPLDTAAELNAHMQERQHQTTFAHKQQLLAGFARQPSLGSMSSTSSPASATSSESSVLAKPVSEEEIMNRKRELLYQFDRLERKGVRLPRKYTMGDSLEELMRDLDKLKVDREVDASVKFQRKMLMACVTGIEFMNTKFDPFDVKLDGWSDSIHDNINDYDDVFEELYVKYRGKAKMAPEMKLMFMIGGSGIMFHLTNSMFKSSLPGLDQVMKQNPNLMRQFAAATMNTMQQQQQPTQPQMSQGPGGGGGGGGGGGLFGLLGGLFGGGSSPGMAAPPAPSFGAAAPPPGPRMRGPVHVDDILRELHQDAFPGGSPHHGGANQRIEVVSNASESEISEMPEISEIPDMPSVHVKTTTRGRKTKRTMNV